jgi:1-acyl-sn-glycerol-3-phosphate acyltransferase
MSLAALAFHCFGRWEITGVDKIPRDGPLILVSNHLSLLDPPLLGASLPRRIRFMAKAELFDSWAGIFISLYGAFPVHRFEADLQALRTARRILGNGEVLGMFPEGHRSAGAGLIQAHPGTALIALQSGAPLLPVAITGTEEIHSIHSALSRPRIRVTIGTPFLLPTGERVSTERVRAASDEIMARIAALLPASYRGAYTYRGAP